MQIVSIDVLYSFYISSFTNSRGALSIGLNTYSRFRLSVSRTRHMQVMFPSDRQLTPDLLLILESIPSILSPVRSI